jgi:DNA-binding transcriptional ArsR family regulator
VVELLDGVFHALADGTRRAMVAELAAGERSVSELAAPHPISLAAASKHVTVLEHFWNTRLDAPEALVTDPEESP